MTSTTAPKPKPLVRSKSTPVKTPETVQATGPASVDAPRDATDEPVALTAPDPDRRRAARKSLTGSDATTAESFVRGRSHSEGGGAKFNPALGPEQLAEPAPSTPPVETPHKPRPRSNAISGPSVDTPAVTDGAPVTRPRSNAISGKPPVELYLRNALEGVTYPDPQRAEFYRGHVEAALTAAAPDLLPVDASTGHVLLKELGNDLVKRLDQYVLQGVRMEAEARPGGVKDTAYSGLMTELTGTPAAKERFLAKYKPMADQLKVESDQLVATTRSLATRVARDSEDIGRTFFAGATPSGISKIHVTNSDPHHGGERVMILQFDKDPAKQVVYKPRDVAIDAKLVGHVAGQTSLAEKTSELIKRGDRKAEDIPTHTFLPREDGGRHYGYVQCLAHGRPEDVVLNAKETKAFYQQSGRLAAMMYFTGTRDLHQGNLMVSGKKPYFTDVEIAFSDSVFRMDRARAPGGGMGGLANMEMGGAFTKGSENDYVDRATGVKDDRIQLAPMDRVKSPTDNFIFDTKSKKASYGGLAQAHAEDVRAGFKEVVDAYAAHPEEVRTLLAGFAGCQVRVHPTPTMTQLMRRQDLKLYPETAALARMERMVRAEEGQDPSRSMLVDSMVRDLEKRDVPYYTRTLGARDLLHNGTTPVHRDRFEDDGLAKAQAQVAALATETGKANAYAVADQFAAHLKGVPPGTLEEEHAALLRGAGVTLPR